MVFQKDGSVPASAAIFQCRIDCCSVIMPCCSGPLLSRGSGFGGRGTSARGAAIVGKEGLPLLLCEGLAAYGSTAVLQDDAVGVGDEHGVGAEGGVFLRGGGAVEKDVGIHAHEVATPIDYCGGVVVATGGECDADAASLPQQSE